MPAFDAQCYKATMSTARDRQHSAPSCGSFMPAALAAGHGHRYAGSSAGNSGSLAGRKVPEYAVTDQTDAVVVPYSDSTHCLDSSTPARQLWADVRPGQSYAAAQPAWHLISANRPATEGVACPAPKHALSWRQQLIRPLYPELRPASAQSQPSSSKLDQAQTDIQAHKPAAEHIPAFRGVSPHQCSASAEAAGGGCAGAKLARGRAWAAQLYEGRQAEDFPGELSGPRSRVSGALSPRQRQPAAAVADAEGPQRVFPHGLAQHVERYAKEVRSSKGEGSITRPNGLNRPSRLSGQQKENHHPASPGGQPQAATQRRAAGSAQKLPSAAHRAPSVIVKEAQGWQHRTRVSSPRHHADTPRSGTHSIYPDLRQGLCGAHVPHGTAGHVSSPH